MTSQDISGIQFERWRVLSKAENSKWGYEMWNCVCICGTEKVVSKASLVGGHSKSCGCYKRDSPNALRHGKTFTPSWRSWAKMLDRAHFRKGGYEKNYHDVSVDPKWLSFEKFFEDMGERPEGTSLNRIKGAKIYSKETCEWSSASLQSYDQRKSSKNVSGKTGVNWRKDTNCWRAYITVDKKQIVLGNYSCFLDACAARIRAEIEYYGFIKE